MREHVRGRSYGAFCDLASEVTHPETEWEWTSQGRRYQEMGIPAAILEAGSYREFDHHRDSDLAADCR